MRSIPERRGSRFHGNVILCWGGRMGNGPVLRPGSRFMNMLGRVRTVHVGFRASRVCAPRAFLSPPHGATR